MLITMDQLPLSPWRASVNTTPIRDLCPSTNGAVNLPPCLAVESFGRLGVEGSNFIDQLAASVGGGRDGRSMVRQGVVKERLLQIISVTTQTGRHFKEGGAV